MLETVPLFFELWYFGTYARPISHLEHLEKFPRSGTSGQEEKWRVQFDYYNFAARKDPLAPNFDYREILRSFEFATQRYE